MLNLLVKNWKLRIWCYLFHFSHVICKISNFTSWISQSFLYWVDFKWLKTNFWLTLIAWLTIKATWALAWIVWSGWIFFPFPFILEFQNCKNFIFLHSMKWNGIARFEVATSAVRQLSRLAGSRPKCAEFPLHFRYKPRNPFMQNHKFNFLLFWYFDFWGLE